VFENFSFTLREVPKLRLFENSVLWRIFRPKSDEVTDELGKLHKEEHNDLYYLPNIVWVIMSGRMRQAGM